MMMNGKKIVVFGLARSGVGAANLLARLGAEVTVTDKKTKDELMEFIKKLSPSVRLRLGGHPEDIFRGIDMIVVSPGIPLDIQPLRKAKKAGIKIIGELELAYQTVENYKLQAAKNKARKIEQVPPYFFAITGTNGKSTTTKLLGLMFDKSGSRTLVGGNIGNALTEEIFNLINEQISASTNKTAVSEFKLPLDNIVAEVSSFQLESIDKFRPRGAAILNITPDHLDRYHSMDEYRAAKARITFNQGKDDFLVLNADDPEVIKVKTERLKKKKQKVFYFSRRKAVDGVYLRNSVVYSNIVNADKSTRSFKLIRADDIRIKGVHNLENAMAASAMALLAKCSVEAVRNALMEFPGLEHRLEFVREFDGVDYINDSKGTNVGAVIKSLESFSRPVILIAGGRDKAGDFTLLRKLIKEKVKNLILIGEAKEKIKKAVGDITDARYAGSLKDAVKMARGSSKKGDVVLLSPACASFDMFMDFEDRGRQFKKIVRGLA